MEKKLTVLPIESKEGVVLELRHGSRFNLRDESQPTGYRQVIKGGKVRVTSEYAELLITGHGINLPHIGWVSVFAKEGESHVKTDDAVMAAQQVAEDAMEDAALAKQAAANVARENEELKDKLAAMEAALLSASGGKSDTTALSDDTQQVQELADDAAGKRQRGKAK